MAINLELPRKLQAIIVKTHQGAAEMMRPIARKYDLKEHAYPVELDTLINLFEGAAESFNFAGAHSLRDEDEGKDEKPQRCQHGRRGTDDGGQLGRRRDDAVAALSGAG